MVCLIIYPFNASCNPKIQVWTFDGSLGCLDQLVWGQNMLGTYSFVRKYCPLNPCRMVPYKSSSWPGMVADGLVLQFLSIPMFILRNHKGCIVMSSQCGRDILPSIYRQTYFWGFFVTLAFSSSYTHTNSNDQKFATATTESVRRAPGR
jgi:hypothetical protein